MSRYAGEYDEDMARGRARAAEAQRRYDQEQEVEYAKWRREHAAELAEPSLYEMKGDWDFVPIRSEQDERILGYKVLVNRKFVAMIIPRGADLVVLMTDAEGGVKASYRRGESIDAQQVMSAFMQHQLPGDPR